MLLVTQFLNIKIVDPFAAIASVFCRSILLLYIYLSVLVSEIMWVPQHALILKTIIIARQSLPMLPQINKKHFFYSSVMYLSTLQ